MTLIHCGAGPRTTVTLIPEIGILFSENQVSEFLLPFNHLYHCWSPVGPSLRGLVLNMCGESGSSAFSVGGRRTSSCRTTSAITTSQLGRIERFCRKRFLENSFSQTAELGEQLLGEQLLTKGSHELRRRN